MKKLVKKIKTSKCSPILENILVQNGVATVSNLETYLTFKTDLKDGFYKKSFFEKGLIVNDNSSQVEDFVKSMEVENGISFLLNVEQIEKLYKATKFCSKDDLRPAMTGVYLNSDGCCGTDANKLTWFDFNCGIKEGVIIQKEFIEVLHLLKSDVNIEVDKYVVKAYTNNVTIASRLIEGIYPNFKAVIPNHYTNYVTIDKKELVAKVKIAANFANKYTKQIVLNINEDELILSAIDTDNDLQHKEVIQRIDGIGAITMGLSHKILLDAINTINSEHLTINFETENKAIVINGCTLLMPSMIKN